MSINFYNINRIIIIILLCLIISQYASAQNSSGARQSPAQIVTKVDEYMNAAAKVEGFSGSILVALDGKPVISKGYGMANYELDVPNTPQTVFRLGSITKQFTAMAVMMLQERNKLTVQDPICKYLEDCPTAWQPITIRHLLTHTSGIPNFTEFPDYAKTMSLPVTQASLIERFKDKPLEFVPGEKSNYSNSGYYLLGMVIERASGKTYADFSQENIFVPLGMKQTGYDDTRSIVKNRAAGYTRQGTSILNAAYTNTDITFSAGALYSTTEDLLRWDQALYTEKLVKRKSLEEMFTPFKEGYGYGWGVGKMFDRRVINHSGGISGFSTIINRFPDDRVTVIVLTNAQYLNAGRFASALSAIVFGAPYQIPQEREAIIIAPEILDKYAGQYQVTPSIIITITNENGKLMGQVTGQSKNELFPESETKFFLKAVNAQVTFVKDAKGVVTNLILHQNGRNVPAKKIK